MQIVDGKYFGQLVEMFPHLIQVDALRSAFEEHPPRRPQETPSGPEDKEDHEQRGDGVGPVPSRRDHDHSGHGGADEAVEIGEHVLEGTLDIERPAIGLGEHPAADQVDDHPGGRHDHQHRTFDRGWVDQALNGFEGHQEAHHEEGDTVDGGGQDLGSLEPVGPHRTRRARREVDRPDRTADGAGVAQHVPGIGQQGQGSGDQGHDDLDGHEPDDERQRDPQAPPVRVGAYPMAVPGVVVIGHAVSCRRGPDARGRRRAASGHGRRRGNSGPCVRPA